MNLKKFSALLDKNNPCCYELVMALESMYERNHLVLELKKESLVEVVQRLCSDGLFPVVDKKLKMVFGAWAHRLPRARLFRYLYHLKYSDKGLPDMREDEAADRYISEGYGYFISSMRPEVIIVGRKYRPDSFDKDLFLIYKTEFID